MYLVNLLLVLKYSLRNFCVAFIVKSPNSPPSLMFSFSVAGKFWFLAPLPTQHLLAQSQLNFSVFFIFFVNAVTRIFLVISADSPTCPTNFFFFFLGGIFDKFLCIDQNFLKSSVVLYYLSPLIQKIKTKFAAPSHMMFFI